MYDFDKRLYWAIFSKMLTNFNKLITPIILITLIVFYFSDLYSTPNSDADDITQIITSELIKEGFENVIVKIEGKTIIVSYENRIYRNEPEASITVISILRNKLLSDMNVVLIPQFKNIPIICIKFQLKTQTESINKHAPNNLVNDIEVNMNIDKYWDVLKNNNCSNTSNYKFDIVVHPQFKARFGAYGDPIKAQINIAPELRTSFWKGMSFSSQLIFPLLNRLDSTGDYIRPGLITLNQTIRLPYNTFVSGTIGYFTENRYGVNLELKGFAYNGRLSLGAAIGYTGYASYHKNTWYYSTDKILTSAVSLFYRNPQFDLNFGVTYGKFIMQDSGWRLDLSRQFGETEIGFYYIRTNTGKNGGFNFSIPLPPSKYWLMKLIRIRPPEYFSWEYRYDFDNNVKTFNTGNKIENTLKHFNPDYFKKQLILIMSKK